VQSVPKLERERDKRNREKKGEIIMWYGARDQGRKVMDDNDE
jgi:hypothetical protein